MSYINDNMFAKAVRYIYNNIDKPIQLEEIASHVGLSLSSLKRLFDEAVNCYLAPQRDLSIITIMGPSC